MYKTRISHFFRSLLFVVITVWPFVPCSWADDLVSQPSKDLLIFIGNNSESLQFVKKINGEPSLKAGPRARDGFSWCVVTQASYGDVSRRDQLVIISSEVRMMLKEQLGQDIVITASKLEECVHNSPFSGNKKIIDPVDILVVQRAMVNDINGEGDLSKFQKFQEMSYSKFVALAGSLEKIKADKAAKSKEFLNTFNKLAAEKNDSFVASIWFAYPQDGGQMLFCTRRGQDVNMAAFNGYVAGAPETVFEAQKWSELQAKRVRINRTGFARIYDSLDAFYSDLQIGKAPCNIYVDYPKDVYKLREAMNRDGLKQKLGYGSYVGNLNEASSLSETYAKSKGFSGYHEYVFANEIKANPAQIKILATHNVKSESSLSVARAAMKKSGYSESDSVEILCQFLQDSDEAKKQGISPKAVKEARESKERERKAQKDREDKESREKYEAEKKRDMDYRCPGYIQAKKACAAAPNFSNCMQIHDKEWYVNQSLCYYY